MTPYRPLQCVLVASLLLAGGCKKGEADDPAAAPAAAVGGESDKPLELEVVGESVIQGDLLLSVNATGQVRSEAITSVKAEASGTVQEILVAPGDKVTKGQVLARLETRILDMNVAEAQSGLNTAEMNYRLALQDDTLARRRITPDREKQLRATSGIDAAQVRLDRARYDREHAVVTAPYEGVVERVGVVVGDRINSGQEIALIVDLQHLRIDAQVMEHDVAALRAGGEAEITIGAVPGKPLRGKIAAVLPLVDSVQKFGRASIRFNGDGVIRPGMFATVRLEATRLPGRIIVPLAAVVERANRPLVFVVHGGIAEWLYINPGPRNDRQVSVLPDTATGIIPLKPGDTVLVAGHRTLTHQAPVRLVARRDALDQR